MAYPINPIIGEKYTVGKTEYIWNGEAWDMSSIFSKSNVTTAGNIFNNANELIKLDKNAKIPALDGSQIINMLKDQVQLGNVDNTADIDKEISRATQIEIDKVRQMSVAMTMIL